MLTDNASFNFHKFEGKGIIGQASWAVLMVSKMILKAHFIKNYYSYQVIQEVLMIFVTLFIKLTLNLNYLQGYYSVQKMRSECLKI